MPFSFLPISIPCSVSLHMIVCMVWVLGPSCEPGASGVGHLLLCLGCKDGWVVLCFCGCAPVPWLLWLVSFLSFGSVCCPLDCVVGSSFWVGPGCAVRPLLGLSGGPRHLWRPSCMFVAWHTDVHCSLLFAVGFWAHVSSNHCSML